MIEIVPNSCKHCVTADADARRAGAVRKSGLDSPYPPGLPGLDIYGTDSCSPGGNENCVIVCRDPSLDDKTGARGRVIDRVERCRVLPEFGASNRVQCRDVIPNGNDHYPTTQNKILASDV